MRRLILSALITLFAACPVSAEDRVEHGDWVSQFLGDKGEASTHDNGTAMFGMLCADRLCRYYYANGIDCDPGSNYPVMVTTAAGCAGIRPGRVAQASRISAIRASSIARRPAVSTSSTSK